MLATKWQLDHPQEELIQNVWVGFIPANQDCPFVLQCETRQVGRCFHTSATKTLPYVCSTANLYALRKKK